MTLLFCSIEPHRIAELLLNISLRFFCWRFLASLLQSHSLCCQRSTFSLFASAMPGFAVRRRCRSYHRWAFPFHSFTMPRHSWPCVAITLIYASHFCCSSHPCNTFLVLRRSIQRSPAANHSAPMLLLHMAPRGYANALRLYSLLLLCLCAAWLRFAITSQGFSIPSHIACWMRVSARWMRVNWRTTPADADPLHS